MGWLGWPHAAVASWAGWLFAAAILILRSSNRIRHITFFALVIAAMIYAGQPEVAVVMGLALVVFLAILLVLRVPRLGGSGPIGWPVLDLIVAAVAGGALGAPLLLPGLQDISVSVQGTQGGHEALAAHDLVYLFTQGFDGLPLAGNHWFGELSYSETASYVGVITLVLAIMAVGVRRRRPEVIAFAVVAVTMAVITFVPRVDSVLDRVPRLGDVSWARALLPLAFALAVLGGMGIDAVVRSYNQRAVRYWMGGGFVVSGGILVALWALGRDHLTSAETTIRDKSFIWPSVDTLVGLLLVGTLILVRSRSVGAEPRDSHSRMRPGRWVGIALLVCESAFLVAAGAPLWTSSNTPFAPTPAVTALKRAVGASLVGLGAPRCFLPPGLGILANTQIVFGVHELTFYDPSAPERYFSSWTDLTGSANDAGFLKYSIYCPGVASASWARLYGVGFVLEPAGYPGPTGAVFDTHIGDEDLFRVPDAAAATLTPMPATGRQPALEAQGVPVAVTHPDPSSWRLVTNASSPQMLRLRLTDVPGWHASIDGRPLQLRRFAGVMLEARVPAGLHTVELSYWPSAFTTGIVLAVCSVGGLCIASIIAAARRPKHRRGARASN